MIGLPVRGYDALGTPPGFVFSMSGLECKNRAVSKALTGPYNDDAFIQDIRRKSGT